MNILTVLVLLMWSTLILSAPAPTKTPAPATPQEHAEANVNEKDVEAVVSIFKLNPNCVAVYFLRSLKGTKLPKLLFALKEL